MPWRGHNAVICKRCERHVDECGPLSARYLCADCGEGALLNNRRHLREHEGHWFQHWRRRVVAAVGGVLVDELDTDD